MIKNVTNKNNTFLTSYDVCNDIKPLENCNNLEIGTKAKNIKIIKEKGGCQIPKTLVIGTNIFNQLLIENKISDHLTYDWSKFVIPNDYQKIIIKKIDQKFYNKPLVIRSSATCEDSPLLSFAGQYSSFLNIKGEYNIIKAIKLCYQSLFSDNAKIYAKLNGVRLEYESMAIAVQELIPVIVAGIIFTENPVNKNKEQMVVEYTKGLGDSIVSGHKKPISQKIKKSEIGNLKETFLKKLSKNALILERVFGNPQDIEWGWDGEEIYIFQSRNITTLNNPPKIINYHFIKDKIIGKGAIACKGVSTGYLKIIADVKNFDKLRKGDIVFVRCKADINKLIKRNPFINGLIINGGILSHLAVITREFNIPCLVNPIIIGEEIEKYKNKKIILDAIKGTILIN